MEPTLIDLIRDIDRRLDEPSDDGRWPEDLAARLQQLRDTWEHHRARWNDEDGLYRDLTDADPRVVPMVKRLRDDSLRLLAACDGALVLLHQLGPDANLAAQQQARAAVREVTAHVERHLSLAASATHDALAVDLGSDA